MSLEPIQIQIKKKPKTKEETLAEMLQKLQEEQSAENDRNIFKQFSILKEVFDPLIKEMLKPEAMSYKDIIAVRDQTDKLIEAIETYKKEAGKFTKDSMGMLKGYMGGFGNYKDYGVSDQDLDFMERFIPQIYSFNTKGDFIKEIIIKEITKIKESTKSLIKFIDQYSNLKKGDKLQFLESFENARKAIRYFNEGGIKIDVKGIISETQQELLDIEGNIKAGNEEIKEIILIQDQHFKDLEDAKALETKEKELKKQLDEVKKLKEELDEKSKEMQKLQSQGQAYKLKLEESSKKLGDNLDIQEKAKNEKEKLMENEPIVKALLEELEQRDKKPETYANTLGTALNLLLYMKSGIDRDKKKINTSTKEHWKSKIILATNDLSDQAYNVINKYLSNPLDSKLTIEQISTLSRALPYLDLIKINEINNKILELLPNSRNQLGDLHKKLCILLNGVAKSDEKLDKKIPFGLIAYGRELHQKIKKKIDIGALEEKPGILKSIKGFAVKIKRDFKNRNKIGISR